MSLISKNNQLVNINLICCQSINYGITKFISAVVLAWLSLQVVALDLAVLVMILMRKCSFYRGCVPLVAGFIQKKLRIVFLMKQKILILQKFGQQILLQSPMAKISYIWKMRLVDYAIRCYFAQINLQT